MSDSRVLEFKEGAVMNGAASEHLKEFIQVVCSYSDVIAIRKSDFIPSKSNTIDHAAFTTSKEALLNDDFLKQILTYATKPIINMESNVFHPCQGLGDMLTLQELLGEVQQKNYVLSWAPHPKPLPLATPHSQLLFPSLFGMNVTLACPPEFKLDDSIMQEAKQRSEAAGGSFSVSHDQDDAFAGAEVVCAKSWLSLDLFGDWEAQEKLRAAYSDWSITPAKMALTSDASFMHCLPVRRNVVASDEVLDSDHSVVIQEAENRMWAQMGLLHYLLTQ
jgi:N-acetylornithine carbamoyltransferase